jgi:hypothetical protein
MLTITIGPFKGAIITADGERMRVYPAFIKQGKKVVRLNDRIGLESVNGIEMLRLRPMGSSLTKRRMRLAETIERGIIRFLNNYHDRRDMSFDCYAFACLVAALPQHDKLFARRFWSLAPTHSLPKEGEILFMMNGNNRAFQHAAVYLGDELFVSVYGAGGQLEFSTLRDIIRDFKADQILLATPRT